MSVGTIGIYAAQNGSETRPTASGRGVFEFKRATGSVAHSVTLAYTLRSTSTTSTADYQPLTGLVMIPAGKRTAAINIIPVDDSLVEGTEKLDITLKSRSDLKNVHTWAEVTIADNDGTASPSVGVTTTANASENSPSTTGKGIFTFTRTGSTAASLTLGYTVLNTSTATAGSDYAALPGSITIPAGQSSATASVVPVDDSSDEGNETIAVRINAGTYTFSQQNATMIIADNDGTVAPGDWFGGQRTSRTAFTFNSGSHARTDQPLDYTINFSNVLSALGKSGALADGSIQVVETNADGSTAINNNVPYQFDHAASGYDASSNASGKLIVQPTGATAANTTRYFQVYFDTTSGFTAPTFSNHVQTTSTGITDEGYDSIKIQTDQATYYYQKTTGGFSSIVDNNGNDWITWNNAGNDVSTGAGGHFRGIPNAGDLGFHPGRNANGQVSTSVSASGPLKTTIISTDPAGDKVTWEIYGAFARCTIDPANNAQGYYFLYEGTPGGSVGGTDSIVRSNNTSTDIYTTSTATLGTGSGVAADEWLYFRDSAVGSGGRYLYLAHNDNDNLEDDYFYLNDSTGDMTVFGFGRQNVNGTSPNQLLTDTNTFTIGLADGGGNFDGAAATIEGQYQAITLMSNGNAKLS